MIRCNGCCSGRRATRRTKNSGWQDRSFCTTREGLLRCVREYCGDVEPAALAKLTALPSITRCKTWTFAEQTKLTPTTNQSRWFLRHWRTGDAGDQPSRSSQLCSFLVCSSFWGINHEREVQDQQHCCACLSRRRHRTTQPKKQPRASKYISVRQATNIIEAVKFARLIGMPLAAHLTLHWSLTDAGDDPDGKLFAKVREGLHKWLHRHGIVFAGAWARERQAGGQSDVVHCHLLFHLPLEYRTGKKLLKVADAISRLVQRHGRGITDERVIKLVIHENPDGKYLIKGGGTKVWKRFRLRKEHRRSQGIIHGKRCGTTEKIGPAARARLAGERLHA